MDYVQYRDWVESNTVNPRLYKVSLLPLFNEFAFEWEPYSDRPYNLDFYPEFLLKFWFDRNNPEDIEEVKCYIENLKKSY